MKLIYVAGRYRGANAWAIECNIREAEHCALQIWRMGAAALCPHTNNRFFQGAFPDDLALRGVLEMCRRCDGIFMVPGWEESDGGVAERNEAMLLGLPVFYTLAELRRWILDTEQKNG